jgi:DNA anti-recombination protein RmuC
MDTSGREVPEDLETTWERTTTAPDPLQALAASRALVDAVGRWQSVLAAEAAADGATWEHIGDALGISRQAAWSRFHRALEEKGAGSMEAETTELKQRIREEVRTLRAELRSMEESHRRARLEAREQLQEMELRAKQERQELRDRVKASIRSLQDQLRERRAR